MIFSALQYFSFNILLAC